MFSHNNAPAFEHGTIFTNATLPYVGERLPSVRESGYLGREESGRLQGVAGDIVMTARDCYETRGISNTSISTVAKKTHISRSSFYLFFRNKDELTTEVLRDYNEDIIESFAVLNETQARGNAFNELRGYSLTLRRILYTSGTKPRPMFSVLNELGIKEEFISHAIRTAAIEACQRARVQRSAARVVDMNLMVNILSIVIFGMLSMLKMDPSASDDEIAYTIIRLVTLGGLSPQSQTSLFDGFPPQKLLSASL